MCRRAKICHEILRESFRFWNSSTTARSTSYCSHYKVIPFQNFLVFPLFYRLPAYHSVQKLKKCTCRQSYKLHLWNRLRQSVLLIQASRGAKTLAAYLQDAKWCQMLELMDFPHTDCPPSNLFGFEHCHLCKLVSYIHITVLMNDLCCYIVLKSSNLMFRPCIAIILSWFALI